MISSAFLRVASIASICLTPAFFCHLSAQCNNQTQPVTNGRLQGGIGIRVSGFDQIPTVSGVPSATTQLTNAVNDLNGQLSANGIHYTFYMNTPNTYSQVYMDVNTSQEVGSAETTGLPQGGWSTVADVDVNIKNTAQNGTPYFSTAGVSAATPKGYDTVFYKFAIHELLHTIGLGDTNVVSPANIMNGVNSTNDVNNSLGDASKIYNLLTPCVF